MDRWHLPVLTYPYKFNCQVKWGRHTLAPSAYGLRHGHQTWMEEAGTSDPLRSERMGHEVPGMRGIYGHVTPAMRATRTAMPQERWKASLRDRTRLAPRSIVPVLDALLAARREAPTKIGSHSAPKIRHRGAAAPVGGDN